MTFEAAVHDLHRIHPLFSHRTYINMQMKIILYEFVRWGFYEIKRSWNEKWITPCHYQAQLSKIEEKYKFFHPNPAEVFISNIRLKNWRETLLSTSLNLSSRFINDIEKYLTPPSMLGLESQKSASYDKRPSLTFAWKFR